MATDKSEPRVGLIFRIGVASVIVLIALRAALAAYFDRITQDEQRRKAAEAKPQALMSLRADERQRLDRGDLPIAQAMHEIASRGRAAASPDIAPVRSKDIAALQGWTQMPAAVPLMMTLSPPGSSDAGAGAAAAAAGSTPALRSPHAPAVGPAAPASAAGAPKKKP